MADPSALFKVQDLKKDAERGQGNELALPRTKSAVEELGRRSIELLLLALVVRWSEAHSEQETETIPEKGTPSNRLQ
jgi:hypothetical protein